GGVGSHRRLRRGGWPCCRGRGRRPHTAESPSHGCGRLPSSGGGTGRCPDPHRVSFPVQERCALASQWLYQRGVRSGVEVLDVVGGALRLGCCLHEQGRIVVQHPHPALEIGRTVLDGGVSNAAHAAEVRCPHFSDQLFFGVG